MIFRFVFVLKTIRYTLKIQANVVLPYRRRDSSNQKYEGVSYQRDLDLCCTYYIGGGGRVRSPLSDLQSLALMRPKAYRSKRGHETPTALEYTLLNSIQSRDTPGLVGEGGFLSGETD